MIKGLIVHPGEMDYRIYEFYMDQFSGRMTYSSHHWSGFIRIKYGTGFKTKLARFWCKLMYGKNIFDKGSI